jgi:hypothetical protein
MKTKTILGMMLAGVALLSLACGQTAKETTKRTGPSQRTQPGSAHVPAYQHAANASALPPTLPPERFIGPTQTAYRVTREIPETIAQLPCYCHCDKSIGHKSLHSCFEDLHASQCTVCVSEALMAYALHKSGLSAGEIRDRIITLYSTTE